MVSKEEAKKLAEAKVDSRTWIELDMAITEAAEAGEFKLITTYSDDIVHDIAHELRKIGYEARVQNIKENPKDKKLCIMWNK